MKIPDNFQGFAASKKNIATQFDPEFIAEIAINLWRLKSAIERETKDAEKRESMRSWKHLQRLFIQLERVGITVQDKTGECYDPGMTLRVIASEQREEINRVMILETLSPTIFFKGNIVHAGEIIVGTPIETQTRTDK